MTKETLLREIKRESFYKQTIFNPIECDKDFFNALFKVFEAYYDYVTIETERPVRKDYPIRHTVKLQKSYNSHKSKKQNDYNRIYFKGKKWFEYQLNAFIYWYMEKTYSIIFIKQLRKKIMNNRLQALS